MTAVVIASVMALTTLGATLLDATVAEAQDIVVVVDPGETQINQPALLRAIGTAVHRNAIRMTDQNAERAPGRLTIAFSRPDRWVFRYEARGQVAWLSDRIAVRAAGSRAHALETRLTELSRQVVERVDGGARDRRDGWDDLIGVLQDEIVDPFADEPPYPARPRVAVLWSEVVDPFADPGSPRQQVWTEVLDPWSNEVRRARR